MSYDLMFNDISRKYYAHLPHEVSLLELILSAIDVESKLDKLITTYHQSTTFTRYSEMVKAWTGILDTEDIKTPHELRTSHAVEILIFVINMYECEKSQLRAKKKLNRHKK